MSSFCVGAELAAATQAWQRIVEGLGESGAEAELRATERVRQAALPLYANLFTLISNQPAGEIGCPRAADTTYSQAQRLAYTVHAAGAFKTICFSTWTWICETASQPPRLPKERPHMRGQQLSTAPSPWSMHHACRVMCPCHAAMHPAAATSLAGAAAPCSDLALARSASRTDEKVHRTAATLGLSQG